MRPATSGGRPDRAGGWLDNGDGTLSFAYAAPGDMNLDWSVDTLDVRIFLAKGRFDTGLPATWGEGDFGYDGLVDILDIADFISTGLFNAGPYNAPLGAIAAVPEPSGAAFVAAGISLLGIGALWRKRAA